MRVEAPVTTDISYIPTEWLVIANQCVANADIESLVALPPGIEGPQELISYRALSMRHNGGSSTALAYPYLLEAGCSPAEIDMVIDQNNQLQVPEFERIPNIYSLSLEELEEVLEFRLAPLYALSNLSLDSEFEHGFNKHGLKDHVMHVAKDTVRMLMASGAGEYEQRIGLLMAYGHDLGNVFTRKYHSLASPYLLAQYVPELLDDVPSWELIAQGIMLHNEPVIAKYIAYQKSLGFTEDEVFAALPASTKALIIADKTHVSPVRVSDKIQNILKALDADDHVEVNYLLETQDGGVHEEEPGVYGWKLKKQPTLSQQQNYVFQKMVTDYEDIAEPEYIEALTQAFGFPTSFYTHAQHIDHGVRHLDTLAAGLFSLYDTRNVLAIRAAFGLFPNIREFRIEVWDNKMNRCIVRSFTWEDKEECLQSMIAEAVCEKEKRKAWKKDAIKREQ